MYILLFCKVNHIFPLHAPGWIYWSQFGQIHTHFKRQIISCTIFHVGIAAIIYEYIFELLYTSQKKQMNLQISVGI